MNRNWFGIPRSGSHYTPTTQVGYLACSQQNCFGKHPSSNSYGSLTYGWLLSQCLLQFATSIFPHSPQFLTERLFLKTRWLLVLDDFASLSAALVFSVFLYPFRLSYHSRISLRLAPSSPTFFFFFWCFYTQSRQVLHGLSIFACIDFTIFDVKLQLIKAFDKIDLVSSRKLYIFFENWKSRKPLNFRQPNFKPSSDMLCKYCTYVQISVTKILHRKWVTQFPFRVVRKNYLLLCVR